MKIYINIAVSICFLVYGQLAVKYGASRLPLKTHDASGVFQTIYSAFLNPWIISGMTASFLSAIAWIFVLQQMDLSRAYPFIASAFILVPLCSSFFLQEPLSAGKLIGGALICAGIIVSVRF